MLLLWTGDREDWLGGVVTIVVAVEVEDSRSLPNVKVYEAEDVQER